MKEFNFVKSGNCHDFYDVLYGTKSPCGRTPKYLKIIDYILENPKHSYKKSELMKHSDYDQIGSELFASFNRNKILVYRPEYDYYGWTKGENFDKWRELYYPESLDKFPVKHAETINKEIIASSDKVSSIIKDLETKNCNNTIFVISAIQCEKTNLLKSKINELDKLVAEIKKLAEETGLL